jgi:hypothetical protein
MSCKEIRQAAIESSGMPTGSFSFALAWLRKGGRVSRKSWNGSRYLFLASCSPNVVAEAGPGTSMSGDDCRFVAMAHVSGAIDVGWTPSTEELLATDWEVVP